MEKNNIDICAEEIKNYYFFCLTENNGRIFANTAAYKVKIWEQVEQRAFREIFINFFKTEPQLRKTKHIKSGCFVMVIKDSKNKPYYPAFNINKKEYETRGDEYLNEVKEHFINIINEKIKEKNGQG